MNDSSRDDKRDPTGEAARPFRVLPGSVRTEASAVAVPLRRVPECDEKGRRPER